MQSHPEIVERVDGRKTSVLNTAGAVVGFILEYPTSVHAFDADGELVAFRPRTPRSPASQRGELHEC